MRLSLIVAASQNNCIGISGDLPWKLSSDLKRFRSLTTGHHIIMGRKTFESLNRLLPERTTVIVTRQDDYQFQGALIVSSVEEALALVANDPEPFVIGGAEIYRQFLPHIHRIYFTHVLTEIDGDAWFPQLNFEDWNLVEEHRTEIDERNEFATRFCIYDRS